MSGRGCLIWMTFYILCFIAVLFLYGFLTANTSWSSYAVWLVVMNTVLFVLYGLDKSLSEYFTHSSSLKIRAPEDLLHSLALAGGFIGGWVGMFLFDHKTNWAEHQWFPIILTVSTLGHAPFIYDRFFS